MNLYNLPTHKKSPRIVNAVIEIEEGSKNKYEYDGDLGVFMYDRCLNSAMSYPASYGFIPVECSSLGSSAAPYSSRPVRSCCPSAPSTHSGPSAPRNSSPQGLCSSLARKAAHVPPLPYFPACWSS